MAHWAELDFENKVIRVIVMDNDDPNGDEGYKWIQDNLGGTWIQTSYNDNFRKRFAGVGFSYDAINDAFIEAQPFPSWVLNDNLEWKAPVPMPETGSYIWYEPTLEWVSLPEEL
jgi:hypothetical protein